MRSSLRKAQDISTAQKIDGACSQSRLCFTRAQSSLFFLPNFFNFFKKKEWDDVSVFEFCSVLCWFKVGLVWVVACFVQNARQKKICFFFLFFSLFLFFNRKLMFLLIVTLIALSSAQQEDVNSFLDDFVRF